MIGDGFCTQRQLIDCAPYPFAVNTSCCAFVANGTCSAAASDLTCTAPCNASTPCGTRPGCHGGLRDERECRDDLDCPPDERNDRPFCVPLDRGCKGGRPACSNCTLTAENSRVSCATCLVCTDEEHQRGRAGCCQRRRHRHWNARDDDDDESSRTSDRSRSSHRRHDLDSSDEPVCDRSRENFDLQCGRKFVCECSYRPCTDRYDVFDATEYFANVCHAVARGKLTALSQHGLSDHVPARIFADGVQTDYYLLDARDSQARITITYVEQLPANALTLLKVVSVSQACEGGTSGSATPPTNVGTTNYEGTVQFDVVVTPGKYIVEVSIVNVPLPNAVCVEYDIRGSTHAPVCPDDAPPCSLHHCFSARECPRGASLRGCDSLRSRCIESIYGDDHDDDDEHEHGRDADLRDLLLHNDHRAPLVVRPSRADCVCSGARDGTPCINSTASGVDGTCTIGRCVSERCTVGNASRTFDCGCVCAPRCHVDGDCNDGNPRTDDFCLRATHQCVNSPVLNHTLPHHRPQPHRHSTTATTTTSTSTTLTLGTGPPSPVALPPSPPSGLGLSLAPTRFVSAAAGPAVATEADRRCARLALDAAERAYAASAMDRVGSFDAEGRRQAPLCTSPDTLRTTSVVVEAERALTPLESSECCSSVETRAYCLGGAKQLVRTAEQWSDAAWLALDNAHRASQAGAAGLAQRDACCAAMLLEALGAQCGRVGDHWALAGAAVVRVEEFGDVGARCMAADDGHPDKDLNDFVFELRRVELQCADARGTCAINLHTLPLAHGGGHQTSLVVATGNGLSLASATVDNGDCPARLRDAMPVDSTAELLHAALDYGTPALAGGSFGEVVHHALHDDGLPHTVDTWTTCVTFGPVGSPNCPRGDVLPLYENTRWPLPLTHPDALERLTASTQLGYREPTTNTQRGTRRVRPLYAASATLVPRPEGTSTKLNTNAVRLLLRNEDCGITALFDSVQMVGAYEMPLSIAVPASACSGWRWAAEGVPVFAVPSAMGSRWCRGGADSALARCSIDASLPAATTEQCAEGGVCAAPTGQDGVPYPFGWLHFQCAARGVSCDAGANGDPACCTKAVRAWYASVNEALVYAEQE